MSKVKIKIFDMGGIDCLANCAFSSECANHCSAGDFRSEGGFTPELTVLDRETADCQTREREIDDSVTYASFPDNYDQLGRGMLVFKKDRVSVSTQFTG